MADGMKSTSIFVAEASSSHTSWSSIISRFVEMGYSKKLVEKAVEMHGMENEEDILEYILACQEQGELKGASLMEMGYSENETSKAIEINGIETPLDELIDFIDAQRHEEDNEMEEDPIIEEFMDKGMASLEEELCPAKTCKREQIEKDFIVSTIRQPLSQEGMIKRQQSRTLKDTKYKAKFEVQDFETDGDGSVFEELTGFGIPGSPSAKRPKELSPHVQGPPFFYFENAYDVPKDVWVTISRYFYGIDAEFVDSKYFSPSSTPRGYIHNLPTEGRFQVLPLPPMTIQEALPMTKKYWPSWDNREKFNCISRKRGSYDVCQKLKEKMNKCQGNLSIQDRAFILKKCKEGNLVWVGPNQLAPLEPNEMELILGYERNHTREASSLIDRMNCLGNSFQTDTVAYHLSTLKVLYPHGIRVLSLFSGIGGAEVALHRLGIYLKCVVAVEICPTNRLILSSWWKRTCQRGKLIQKEDVRLLTRSVLEELVDEMGGFDLVIGGYPYYPLSGKNIDNKEEWDGTKPSIFFEFPRIVNEMRQMMQARNMN